jgi:hypothetical protein
MTIMNPLLRIWKEVRIVRIRRERRISDTQYP